ncbi:MAG: hypothetical protein LBD96_02825 [Treponema sp.]|nr:hypothetical protein [Treponema sp.]
MRRKTFFTGMLLLTFMIGFVLTGCFSLPVQIVSAGEALDAIGGSRAAELQYLAGNTIILTLMRSKNGQLDSNAIIKNGEPAYTRESISIPYGTKGMVVQRTILEDGRLMLGVTFEDDESKFLWFVQNTAEMGPYTHFSLSLDDASSESVPIVKYGNAYYWVQWGSDAILGIVENAKVSTRYIGGKKIN